MSPATVTEGPLTGWPIVEVGDGAIAVGRHCWGRISGTFTADEAWAAWSRYWDSATDGRLEQQLREEGRS